MTDVLGGYRDEDVDQIGKLLYGRPLRLAVTLFVIDHLDETGAATPFYQSEAAEAIRYGASAVTSELKRLIELEMLIELPAVPGSRRLYYQANLDSDLWESIRAVRDALRHRATTSDVASRETDAM